ncbi:MAG TPA: hypothetical protein VFG14_03400 [Chthoniobacteraceae bacterium]|nr:hypothetical protein [Chthoniobacteraceae bacterium]
MNRSKTIVLICTVFGAFAAGHLSAQVRQPNMQAALIELKQARAALEAARPHKGGHRDKAIDYTNLAIDQVQRGIKFALENP